MIPEAYVSFETAKLLKEKGFNYPCHATYDTAVTGGKPQFSEYEVLSYFPYGMKNTDDKYGMIISAPTHQRAMKWLRKEHSIYIGIRRTLNTYLYGAVIVAGIKEVFRFNSTYSSYEQVVEEAIKYSLENLI